MDPKSRVSIAQFSRGDRGHSSPGKFCNLEALKSHLAWRVSRGTFAEKNICFGFMPRQGLQWRKTPYEIRQNLS